VVEKMSREAMVAIAKGKDIRKRTVEVLNLMGGIERFVDKGDKVLIKPNIVDGAPFVTGEVVQLETIEALTQEVLRAGAREVLIGETPGIVIKGKTDTWKAYEKAAQRLGVEFLCLLDSFYEEVVVEDPVFFEKIKVPKPLLDCDTLINVPALKTCSLGITVAVKNYYGFLPDDDKRLFHEMDRVEEAILDLYQIRKADLIVVDGTYTTFHSGPRPIEDFVETARIDLTLAGVDPIAIDTVSATILGTNPETIRYLRWGEQKGFGTKDLERIRILGTSLKEAYYGKGVDVVKFANRKMKDVKILNFGACTGCLSLAMAIQHKVRDKNLSRKLLFVMGPEATDTKVQQHSNGDETIILCGQCAAPTFFNMLEGKFLFGCPPPLDDVTKKIQSLGQN
jgi:uncharacterized protein (DUF362 family)